MSQQNNKSNENTVPTDGAGGNNPQTTSKSEPSKQEKRKHGNNNGNNDGKADSSKKPSPEPNDQNTNDESPFVKLVRRIKIADLEKEVKEDDDTTSILGKFKDYEQDLIDMTQDGTKKDDIVSFVMDSKRVGLTNRNDATLFATRLLKAHPKQSQSNGL